jgi:integrase/recombinase XerC/integrase/recombinase XerD
MRNELAVQNPAPVLQDHVSGFLRNQVSVNTQGTYGRALERYLTWCREQGTDPARITLEQAVDYRADVQAHFADSSAALHVSALKSFYKLLKEIGILHLNIWAAVKAPGVPKTSQTESLDQDQLRSLYAKAEKSGQRDLLIVRLLYEAAMRREEVAAMPKDALTHVPDGWALLIQGKGDKDVKVGITDELAHAIAAWAKKTDSQWLFPGRTPDKHLDKRQINNILERFGIHPHQLRHSFVTAGLKQGIPIQDISRAVRHESIQTTMRYYDERQRVTNSALRKLNPVT